MAKTKKGVAPDYRSVLNAVSDPARRKDAYALAALMKRVTGEKPRLWSGAIIGFGEYHYRYPTGHEGDSCLAGFSPRKTEFSIYLMGTYFPEQGNAREALLARLGKHRMGKACLYVKKLADIDLKVLEKLVRMSVMALRRHYPKQRASGGKSRR